MKKTFSLIICLLLALCLAAPCFAAQYRSDIYRINDFAGVLSKDDIESVDSDILSFVEEYGVDLPICIRTDLSGWKDGYEYLDSFFGDNSFGYGDGNDGVAVLLLTGSGDMYISSYGDRGEELLEAMSDSNEMDAAAGKVYKAFGNGKYASALKDFVKAAGSAADSASLAASKPTGSGSSGKNASQGSQGKSTNKSSDLPDWFPADDSTFVEFHDYDAPRLVDNANMFTPAEEKQILEHIKKLRDEQGADLVVFTDTSTHGLSARDYAIAFHRYNGYGLGDDFSGSVLFICMDPNDRQWITEATGDVEKFYTSKTINDLDDLIYDDMVDGNYAKAITKYVDSVGYLYEHGTVPEPEKDPAVLAVPGFVGLSSGLLAAIARVAGLKNKMKNIHYATDAKRYVKRGLALSRSNDRYLYTNRVRTRIETHRSSGGGGGGHSSFGSGHSSFGGGRSYSGGGRHF